MRLTHILAFLASPLLCGAAVAQSPDIGASDAHLVQDHATAQSGFVPRATWLGLPAAGTGLSRPGGAWIGGKFFLVGGETTGGARNAFANRFDGPSMTWTVSPFPMPDPVSNIFGSTCAIGSKIYVVGGYTASLVPSPTVQVYDTIADSWSVMPTPLPAGIWGALAVHVGGTKILVSGGYDGVSSVPTTYIYDVAGVGSVTMKSAAPTPRYLLSGAYNPANGKVYSVGGFGTGTVMQAYDVAGDSWTTLASLPNDRAGCGVIAAGGKVVAYMGNWTVYRADGDLYDIATNTWMSAVIPAGPLAKRAFAYGILNIPGVIQGGGAFGGWAGAYLTDCSLLRK